jgi:UDP-N-acetyl-D-glucosamine dehydrogenase
VLGRIMDALNDRGRSIRSSSVLVLGIAYKKNVDDIRESPAVELMELLQEKGAVVHYSDPHIPRFPTMREHNFNLSSVELTPETIGKYDLLLLATDHAKFDYEMIRQYGKLIIDTRGVYRKNYKNIVKA